MQRLKQINEDIKYLKQLSYLESCCSFGGKLMPPVNPEISFTICGIPIKIYYYESWEANTYVLTPFKKHTSYSSKHEGPHHPICKINLPGYEDYIFTQNGIKLEGTTEILSIKEWKNINPNKYDDIMLLGIIISYFYSLKERLDFYIKRYVNKDTSLDIGHKDAPYVTKENLDWVITLLKEQKYKNCVNSFLNEHKLDDIMNIYDKMYDYEPYDRKLIKDINVAYNNLKFIKSRVRLFDETKV